MYGISSEKGYTEVMPGIKMKNLCYGEKMNLTKFILKKNALLPEHNHENEQTGYLVKGKIRLFINNISRELKPGDSWNIKSNEKHKAEILEDSVAIEVFSPQRADYLPFLNIEDTIQ
jgi:quercetin dioxygenase-like cupin family protein